MKISKKKNNSVNSFSLFLLVLLSSCEQYTMFNESAKAVSVSGQKYYVSNEGDDSNSGLISDPLKSIAYALTLAEAGDSIIVREGIYFEKLNFPRSGSTNAYITLTSYAGENALISGNGLASSGHDALIKLSSVDWIRINGMEIAHFSTSDGGKMLDGILVEGSSSHIEVTNNHVHHIHNNASPSIGREAHAIHFKGNGATAMTDILIANNIIHDNRTGTSENLTVNGFVDGFIIQNNEIYDAENIAICIAGGYGANGTTSVDYARNGLVTQNKIWNINGKTGQVPVLLQAAGTIGIYIDGARNITVERNKIWDSDRGIGLVSENDGFPTAYCIVRNNLIYNNRAEGIYIGGYANYPTGGTRSSLVLNNTLYHNAGELGYYGEQVGEIRINANCHYNEIHNNILVSRPDMGTFIRKNDNSGSFNGIDFNLYYTTGSITRWFWNGNIYNSLTSWNSNSGGDSNGLFGNPMFNNLGAYPPDFSLQISSPAINAGTNSHTTSAGNIDFLGLPRYISTIDMGAFEYQ
ncbi:choice-of-anchor Q domain-containing protein [Sphingobacterium chuzhouense]|uniref:Right-handed parallel beta-helix repeat-containing protein n=1 Tax=Sphingobacterium chuzhouense TaxID=1742264 RepID=A0ABR7XS81_9SPHI|nr:choice-of-anchor Q domain-containing protein [Sphingobacterium chuzhouense]MBD1422030.1 right-handed parallel beta-helix repeat-containing protein [Sphingobacterium chuzhouense]